MAKKLAVAAATAVLAAITALPGTAGAAPATSGACRGDWTAITTCVLGPRQVVVVHSEVPYPTERFTRIGYTLALWDFTKQGLVLRRIEVRDGRTDRTLLTLSGTALPILYSPEDELPPGSDPIVNAYLSIQLPIPLGRALPQMVTHRFVFTDLKTHRTVVVRGGTFRPRASERPIVLPSPVRGRNLAFVNQSTDGYHFDVLLFMDGTIHDPEHFASDIAAFDDQLRSMSSGNPGLNETFHIYGSSILAVADGTVVKVRDGFPENHGSRGDPPQPIVELEDYLGNYVVLDIGGGRYATYMHCIPGSFAVRVGDRVRAGDALARVGNSGNSGAPHLHFQVTDGPDPLRSHGLPFVLAVYTKVGEFDGLPVMSTGIRTPAQVVRGAMMEQTSAVDIP